jgi:hypothetical protein
MPESALLVAIAAHGLPGSRTDSPDGPLCPNEWFDLVQGCLAADLIGFLAAAAAGGRLPVSPSQADELAELNAERTRSSLVVERLAAHAAAILAARGIDHRIVDGPARRLAYGDAGVRHARCTQLLVPANCLPDAAAAVLHLPRPVRPGGQPPRHSERIVLRPGLHGTAAPGEQPRAVRSVGPGVANGTGSDLDRLGPATLLAVDGHEVAMLDLELQLVVACADVAASPAPPLALVRDVAQIALSPALEATRARRLADANDLTPALALGLARAWGTFDLADKTPLSVWALRMRGGQTDIAVARTASLSGLTRRMLGRWQPGPVAWDLANIQPSMIAATAKPAPHRSPRR